MTKERDVGHDDLKKNQQNPRIKLTTNLKESENTLHDFRTIAQKNKELPAIPG